MPTWKASTSRPTHWTATTSSTRTTSDATRPHRAEVRQLRTRRSRGRRRLYRDRVRGCRPRLLLRLWREGDDTAQPGAVAHYLQRRGAFPATFGRQRHAALQLSLLHYAKRSE